MPPPASSVNMSSSSTSLRRSQNLLHGADLVAGVRENRVDAAFSENYGAIMTSPVASTINEFLKHKACGRASLKIMRQLISFSISALTIMLGMFASNMITHFVDETDLQDYNYYISFAYVMAFCSIFAVMLMLFDTCALEKLGESNNIIVDSNLDKLGRELNNTSDPYSKLSEYA